MDSEPDSDFLRHWRDCLYPVLEVLPQVLFRVVLAFCNCHIVAKDLPAFLSLDGLASPNAIHRADKIKVEGRRYSPATD